MKKSERHAQIRAKAEVLARSGKFALWIQIEWELRRMGHNDAREVLDNKVLRKRLDALCRVEKPALE